MQNYKLIAVLSGKPTSAKLKSFQEKIKRIVDINKGKIAGLDDWGEINFAYKIKGNVSGNFWEFRLELKPESVKAIDDKLRLENSLIRYLLVKQVVNKSSEKDREGKNGKKS